MRVSTDRLQTLLVCPCTAESNLVWASDAVTCSSCDRSYPIIAGKPVIIRFERSIVDEDVLKSSAGSSVVKRPSRWQEALSTLIFGRPSDSRRRMAYMAEQLRQVPDPVILVVGGGETGFGMEGLDQDAVTIVSFDVYSSPEVDFIADGHEIPIAPGSVDAVIVQAVLEHVLDPQKVVGEIHRVLKPGGLVYAETPFIQQVHEGPYDFTRFTESGHRWLFRRFERIDSGTLRGPGTALLWSIRYAIAAIIGNKKLAALLCLPVFWIRFLDQAARPKQAIDAACDVYFLGRRTETAIEPKAIVAHYQGAIRS